MSSRDKITQKQMAFYKLYRERKVDAERYVPTWEFVGEMHVEEMKEWVLMSYKCPTRLTDLFQENPNLLERKLITGKSGSTYYGYRFKAGITGKDILDPLVYAFYNTIRARRNESNT